ncbi:MAG: sensor histidine kinase [Gaiellales bacterium]
MSLESVVLQAAGWAVLAGAVGTAVAWLLHRREAGRERADLARELAASRDAVASREAMLAKMQEGIVLFAPGGQVRYLNAAATDLLGHPVAHALEVESADLRHAVNRVLRGDDRNELVIDTGGRAVEVTVTETDPSGSALLVARDVTAARRTEQLRRNFVANASHELKTPVSSIMALASALNRAISDAGATPRFVGMLEREAERLSALVSDLLDLSRLENDAGPPEPVRLDQVVVHAADKLVPRASAAGLRLLVDQPRPVLVMGREPDLDVMVHNLLDNAIRYTHPGGEVRLTLRRRNGSALITVEDTGIGIPAGDLGRVFERFYRVDAARDKQTGGTGLGLAIVRHVAESHGGQVGVTSVLGSGSTFTATIPLGSAS